MKGSRETRERIEEAGLPSGDQARLDQAWGELGGKMLKEGMAPKEAMGLNESYLENIYAQAYRLYNTGKYAEAVHLFRLLILLSALEPKYTLGLAACQHMLKEYNNAIQTYTICSALDPHTPLPSYHSSDCFIQMKDYLSAMLCLELAIERAGDKPEYATIKERSLLSLESLKTQVNAASAGEEKPLTEFNPEQLNLF